MVELDVDVEARRLFTSIQQRFVGMSRNQLGKLPAPIDDIDSIWQPSEGGQVDGMLMWAFVGSVFSVRLQLQKFLQRTQTDELMVTFYVRSR